MPHKKSKKVVKSDEEWRQQLSPEQYRVVRQEGTEPAFSGEYHDSKKEGVYTCIGCGNKLFSSESKFDSGTGWPSFSQPIGKENIGSKEDKRLFRTRTEVHCNQCGAHLGHVFDDGPDVLPDGKKATGKRYCVNSLSLKLKEKNKK